jgi:protein involved in polysaccharide export with SLBB domain
MIRFASLGILLTASLLLAVWDFVPVLAEPEPRLQVGDRLTITLYNEPLLTGVYEVTPSGTVVMPLIGPVRAVGRTPSELAKIIADRYRGEKFLKGATSHLFRGHKRGSDTPR